MYKAYWIIQGKLEVLDFRDTKQFNEMCENIVVSEGEEGRSPKLYFIVNVSSGVALDEENAARYFREEEVNVEC